MNSTNASISVYSKENYEVFRGIPFLSTNDVLLLLGCIGVVVVVSMLMLGQRKCKIDNASTDTPIIPTFYKWITTEGYIDTFEIV